MATKDSSATVTFTFKRSTLWLWAAMLMFAVFWHERANLFDFYDGVIAGYNSSEVEHR